MVGVGGIGMSITGSVSQIGTSAFCAGGTVRIAIDAISSLVFETRINAFTMIKIEQTQF